MAAGLSASTHAVCRLRSAFLRMDAQAWECARAAVVKLHVNECLLPPSLLHPVLFHFHVFNEKCEVQGGRRRAGCTFSPVLQGRESGEDGG